MLVGAGNNVKNLHEAYDSEKAARDHADGEWKLLLRGEATLELTLALGRADLYPEQQLILTGFKAGIGDRTWLIAKATHRLDGTASFTTSLELETTLAPTD